MDLGSRIARLRGDRCPNSSDSSLDVTGADHRLSVQRATVLADQLGGEVIGEGAVVCETRHPLSTGRLDQARLSVMPEMHGRSVSDWIYIDTETTGLSGGVGTLAFMVGVARYLQDGDLLVRQYTLSRFADEAPMLGDLVSWIGNDATLCSYNGRCFDLPLLVNRLRLHRQSSVLSDLSHLDLMYGVRRAYRDQWPDCRLQTAERRRLGIRRVDDMPGALAPTAWQKWLAHADPSMLIEVLKHNLQDVVSLAALHLALVDDYADATHPDLDPGAVARAWYKAGCTAKAMAIWETHAERLSPSAALQQAAAYRRAGWWEQAEAVWLRLYEQGNADAALALAKYYEHRCRDFHKAMRFAVGLEEFDAGARQRRLHRKLSSDTESGALCAVNMELPLLPRPLGEQGAASRHHQI